MFWYGVQDGRGATLSTVDGTTASSIQGLYSNDESHCLSLGARINAFENYLDKSLSTSTSSYSSLESLAS